MFLKRDSPKIFLNSHMDIFQQFGIDPLKFFTQVFFAFSIFGLPAIYATIAVIRSYHSGAAILACPRK